MAADVLVLNTAVLDLRSRGFDFVDALVGAGGLAKCPLEALPHLAPEEIFALDREGGATAGGCGNVAPLLARAGLRVAVGAMLGGGPFRGLDAAGRIFADKLAAAGVDLSAMVTHPTLPTGTTFIHLVPAGERGGIAYFPNANDDFDFEIFRAHVKRLRPTVVHYMYSGLSARGDADGGRDLARFLADCRALGAMTVADSHTLAGNPAEIIRRREPVPAYRLLEPLWPELDVLFTSADEARMILNTLEPTHRLPLEDTGALCRGFLDWVLPRAMRWRDPPRPRLFGVTVANGAWARAVGADGVASEVVFVRSRFLAGEVVDLVGAGDAFRAGVIAWLARHAQDFRAGRLALEEAVQLGNLTASLFIKAPLRDRCAYIAPLPRMLEVVRGGRVFDDLPTLLAALGVDETQQG
ncbi:MAG: carbohydrate kinase family protein [Kiritimatiellae bacterium]|nr:carbohydrate kinase family protein [Kiritimatiellia bacterium]